MPDDSIIVLQKAVETRLKTSDDFTAIAEHVIREDTDVATRVATALQQINLALIITLPDFVTGQAESILEGVVVVNIVEKPIVNRGGSGTGMRATSAGLRVLNLLRHWAPGGNWQTIEKCRLLRPDPATRPDLWQFNGRSQLLLPT